MTDTANAPERIWTADTTGNCSVGFNTPSLDYKNEYISRTHCDELVAAAYLDALDSINEYPRVAPEADEANAYDEQIEHCQGIIDTCTPDDARAALTAYGERMKAEGALDAQAKIARLTEALAIAGPIALKVFDYHLFTLDAEDQRKVETIRAALQENANG